MPNRSILPLKPPPEDFTPNISILEEITRKISFSKISKISKKTLISAHQKSKKIIRNNQSTPSKYTSGTMDSISSNSHGIGSLCEFSKKNSGIVDEQPKENRRNHKNELQTSTSSTKIENTFNLSEPRIIGTTKDDDSDCDFEDSSSLLSEQDCDYDSNCDDEDSSSLLSEQDFDYDSNCNYEDSSSLLSEYECDDRSDCDGEDFDSDCDIAGVIWPPPSSNETSMGRVDCPDENLDCFFAKSSRIN